MDKYHEKITLSLFFERCNKIYVWSIKLWVFIGILCDSKRARSIERRNECAKNKKTKKKKGAQAVLRARN